MRALIEAARDPAFPARIALVISNEAGAPGLRTAAAAGATALAIPHRDFPTRPDFEAALHRALVEHAIAFVCLAGFMRLLTPDFVALWSGRMISIHPSLLPAFRGLDTHARALAAGVKIHGCTVHHVVPELDAGPIVAQAAVPVLPDDDVATLAARVLAQEHVIFPRALGIVAADPPGQVAVKRQGSSPGAALVVPEAL